jgi:hypothetical protein
MTHAGAKSSTLTERQLLNIREAVLAGPVRPFLVTLDRSSGTRTAVNVHVATDAIKASSRANGISHARMKRDISRGLSALGLDVAIRVAFHSRRELDRAASLEQFLAKFGFGTRLYDPAGVFDEAERLVEFACELRRQFAAGLTGIYWSSRWRTTYVLLNEHMCSDGFSLWREKLVAAERSVISASEANVERKQTDRIDWVLDPSSDPSVASASRNVRLCFDLPAVQLVPVDKASLKHRFGLDILSLPSFPEFPKFVRISILSALFGLGSTAIATAALPPVESKTIPTGAKVVVPPAFEGNQIGSAVYEADPAGRSPAREGDIFVGGPGLHPLWRNAIGGARGPNSGKDEFPVARQPEPMTRLRTTLEDAISRTQFFETSRSGETFGGSGSASHNRTLDLRWFAAGSAEFTADRSSNEFPTMQPGVAAVFGLPSVGVLSDEAHAAVLESLNTLFGLPASRPTGAAAHFDNSLRSDLPASEVGRVLGDELEPARGESHRERSRRLEAKYAYYDERHSSFGRRITRELHLTREITRGRPRGSSG